MNVNSKRFENRMKIMKTQYSTKKFIKSIAHTCSSTNSVYFISIEFVSQSYNRVTLTDKERKKKIVFFKFPCKQNACNVGFVYVIAVNFQNQPPIELQFQL